MSHNGLNDSFQTPPPHPIPSAMTRTLARTRSFRCAFAFSHKQQSTKTINTMIKIACVCVCVLYGNIKRVKWDDIMTQCDGFRNSQIHSQSPCKLIISDSPHAILFQNNFWHFAYVYHIEMNTEHTKNEKNKNNQQCWVWEQEKICMDMMWIY